MSDECSLSGGNEVRNRVGGVSLFALAAFAFQRPLRQLATLAANDEHYTHLLIVLPITVGLLLLDRGRVFRDTSTRPFSKGAAAWVGGALALLAAAGNVVYPAMMTSGGPPTIAILALILLWFGIFVSLWGAAALRRAWFPAVFLLLLIPLPSSWVLGIEGLLQRRSADLTHVFFNLSGMPVFREGLTFVMPAAIRIEVAPECSGIRSSFAMFITSLLLGHLFLRSAAPKVLFALITLPLLIVKNAVRIATLSWLGVYVSRDYLTGDLHHRGGLVFFLFALILLVPILLALHKLDRRQPKTPA